MPIIISCILAVAAAFLCYYCHWALWPVMPLPFIMLVPYFLAVLLQRTKKSLALVILCCSLPAGFLALNGVQGYGTEVYVISSLFVSAKYALIGLFAAYFYKNCSRINLVPFYVAGSYVFLDMLYSKFTYIATGRIGATLSYDTLWIQFADITGHSGIGFVVIFVNVTLALFAARFISNQSNSLFSSMLASVLLLILLSGYGYYKLNISQPEEGKEVTFGVLQGSITKKEYEAMTKDRRIWDKVVNHYFSLSRKAAAQGFRYIIWPETAVRSFVGIRKELKEFYRTFNSYILGGFPRVVREDNGQYNSVLWLDPDGQVKGHYYKNFLIPVSEKEFITGKEAEPIKTFLGAFATPICFEIFFPSFVRSIVDKGGQAIIVFTNDSGFKYSKISAVVLKQAILRTVENRRPMIRAAQSGISAVVTAEGQVTTQTGLFEELIIPATIRLRDEKTIYTRYGEWFPYTLLALMLLLSRLLKNKP